MSDLCVFTTGNNLDLLRESCNRVGITLRTYDVPWTTYVDVKLRAGLRFLETVAEPYAMWVDGNDSLVLKPEEEILKRFRTMGGIVFSAEKNCWPDPVYADLYPQVPEPLPRFLNAGGFIGSTLDLCAAMQGVIREADRHSDWDDQRAWTRWFLSGGRLNIDHDRHIFASVGDGAEALRSDACVLHWNGKIPGREEFWNGYVASHPGR